MKNKLNKKELTNNIKYAIIRYNKRKRYKNMETKVEAKITLGKIRGEKKYRKKHLHKSNNKRRCDYN